MRERPAVLVIDDDPQVRRLLALLFQSAQYRVVTAATRAEGVTLARAERPDLITLEIDFLDGSGLDGVRHLTREAATEGVPILVISTLPAAEGQEDALRAGAAGYLEKPFIPDDLLRRLASILGRGGPAAEGP